MPGTMMKRPMYKKGGKMKKKKSFPDMSGDGKVTLEGTNPEIQFWRSSDNENIIHLEYCLLYTSPSPRD